MMLEVARVVAIHPESHSVDVCLMNDGRRVGGVQVLSTAFGTNFGLTDLATPDLTTGEPYETGATWTRDIYGIVAWLKATPVVLGFIAPQVSQMNFDEDDRMIYRHSSDVYMTVDKDGNTELFHPSGAYVRIATDPAHEDLTGKDYDKIWKIVRNTDKAVHIHIEQANNTASINIDPPGNIDVIHDGNLTTDTGGYLSATIALDADMNVGGNLTVDVEGTTHLTSGGTTTITAPLIVLDGNVVVNGTVSASGDITSDSVSLQTHIHTGVKSGSDTSGVPVG